MPRMRGFTLLEILIVMVLIAILTAAAVNTINFVVDEADAETEAKRIAALSALAAEEALLTGREYGLRVGEEELQFFLFDDVTGQWQSLSEDDTFHPRPVPESLEFDLVLEGQAIMLGDEDDDNSSDDRGGGRGDESGTSGDEEDSTTDDDQPEPPQLVFLSSGEITPFTLTISERKPGGETWTVEGDLLGRMDIKGEPR